MSAESTPMSTPESSVYTPTESSVSGSVDSLSFNQSASFIAHPSSPSPPSPRSIASDSSLSTDDEAEAEWQESLQQLELLFSLVVIPFFGKWVGRRCAYWAWTRFMTWKYPVDIVITNRKAFNIAGALGALSTGPTSAVAASL
ncbi:hypothetical protein BZA05DRAFT_383619 [Tricharina praecox]|uniref:uncharacterized protein n=1 Tax=Tricharina praecox TaxID=43433 RepID=UPI002220BA78|nr:uncharacterized protein BZA05DRAFT_383619 [Tricharina praecox]KAI5859191.1 hypothetical protein BZA05DRAFT_383619 [Tricharina praecox]